MADRRTVLIAGGGIAGLTVAICLARRGFRVEIFERGELGQVNGAGIQISPNAMQVLSKLGLSRQLLASGFAPASVILRSGLTGKLLSQFETGPTIRTRHDQPFLVLHRTDLINILAGACREHPDIEIHERSELTDYAVHANGLTALVNRDDRGYEQMGNVLIGADGVWSKFRKHMPHGVEAQFTGDVAWRGIIALGDIPTNVDLRNTHLWLGKKAHVVHYPLRQGQYLNVVAVTPAAEFRSSSNWISQSGHSAIVDHFENWPDELKSVLSASGNWGGWPLYSVSTSAAWSSDRMVLIGDAAHAMLPYAAQGGCAAIEDAWILAEQMEQNREDIQAGINAYVKVRRPRINRLAKLARSNKRIYHMSGIPQEFRDVIMARLSQERLQSRMDWVYGWKPGED